MMDENITSITPENITTFRNYGFALTPVKMDKSPATKNGSWCKDWSDTELLNAKRIGVFHKDSGSISINL